MRKLVIFSVIIIVLLSGCIELSDIAGTNKDIPDFSGENADNASNNLEFKNDNYSLQNEGELDLYLVNTQIEIYANKSSKDSYYNINRLASDNNINLLNYINESEANRISPLVDEEIINNKSDQNVSELLYISDIDLRKYTSVNEIINDTDGINKTKYNVNYYNDIYSILSIKQSVIGDINYSSQKQFSEQKIVEYMNTNITAENITFISSNELNHAQLGSINYSVYKFKTKETNQTMNLIYASPEYKNNRYVLSGIIKDKYDDERIIDNINNTKIVNN